MIIIYITSEFLKVLKCCLHHRVCKQEVSAISGDRKCENQFSEKLIEVKS